MRARKKAENLPVTFKALSRKISEGSAIFFISVVMVVLDPTLISYRKPLILHYNKYYSCSICCFYSDLVSLERKERQKTGLNFSDNIRQN